MVVVVTVAVALHKFYRKKGNLHLVKKEGNGVPLAALHNVACAATMILAIVKLLEHHSALAVKICG